MKHTTVKKVLAVITDEEVAEIRGLSETVDNANAAKEMALNVEMLNKAEVTLNEASNASFDWFDSMADKYGFSKEIQCHVNFGPRTICEGLSREAEHHDHAKMQNV